MGRISRKKIIFFHNHRKVWFYSSIFYDVPVSIYMPNTGYPKKSCYSIFLVNRESEEVVIFLTIDSLLF